MSNSKINPTFFGYIGSTKDALLIIQACLNNQLLTVPRRPHDRERSQLITSGNVFVFIEERSGIKRWTDGVAWSPSRILGRFLVYRELDRQALNNKDKSKYNDKKKLKKKSIEDLESTQNSSNSIPNRSLVGSLVTSYAFKEYGLIKKTLSLTINRLDSNNLNHQETIHLVSYYSAEDVLNGKLQRPCDETNLSKIQLSNELWNAVKDSSLGGKIPIEDEAYYFMDQSNPNAIALGFNPAIHLQPQYQQHNHSNGNNNNNSNNHNFLPTPLQQLPHPNSQNSQQQQTSSSAPNQSTTTSFLPPPISSNEPQQSLDLQNVPMFYQYPRYSPSIYQQQQPPPPAVAPSSQPPQRRHTTQTSPISPSSPQFQQKEYSPSLKDVGYTSSSILRDSTTITTQPPILGGIHHHHPSHHPQHPPPVQGQLTGLPSYGYSNPLDLPISNQSNNLTTTTSSSFPPPPPPTNGAGQISGVGSLGNQQRNWFGYDENGYVGGYQFNQNH